MRMARGMVRPGLGVSSATSPQASKPQAPGGEGARPHCHRRDSREQGPAIDPAGHPRPLLTDEPPRPGIEPAGYGKLRYDLAKNETDEVLPGAGQKVGPEHWRTTSG